MKRKLNDQDVPTAADTASSAEPGVSEETMSTPTSTTKIPSFVSLGLDPRLLQAIAQQNYSSPTAIQARSIPLALEGKDVLARSKTGSGKTAAYVLPILHSTLQRKISENPTRTTSALILVPTRELAQQVSDTVSAFSAFCSKDVRTINITRKIPEAVQRSLLAESPDIVVATPARATRSIQISALSVDSLTHLVVDEADLVLSYGYEDDLQAIAKAVPKGIQTSLMSATLTAEVDALRGLFCRDPIILDLEDAPSDGGGVSQYVVKCAEDEKFLLAYVIFKLKLIKGKCIIFVGDIDRCYRLKLFFEQFGIKSCVLNSELPVNSRLHVIEAFNKNVYDIIIAADEHEIFELHKVKSSAADSARTGKEAVHKKSSDTNNNAVDMVVDTPDEEHQASDDDEEPAEQRRKGSKKRREYGVSRGIDFQNVSCVLNFDLPTTSKSYTHRIGRTARAGKSGMALSFAVPSELYHKHPSTTLNSTRHDEEVLEKIMKTQQKKGQEVKPYHFDMKQVDAFRYRMNDALRAVTRIAVREARTRELRQELLNSEKLKRHFAENPDDLHHLRHDSELRSARIQQHLKHVPDYLMPSSGNKGIARGEVGFVGLRKTTDNRIRRARTHNRMKGKGRKTTVKKSDPLKSFNAKGRR